MHNNLFSWLQMRLNYSKLPARVNWDEFVEVSREIMGSEYSSSKALGYGAILMECFRFTYDDKALKSALDHHKLILEHIPLENLGIRLRALSNFGSVCLFHFQRYHNMSVLDGKPYGNWNARILLT